jgi:hypothetical protein
MNNNVTKVFNIKEHSKRKLFIMLIFFLNSFAIVRSYSVFVGGGILINGYHIHHFYFGTMALAIGGIIAVLNNSEKRLLLSSALIGIGLGLFVDEIGLLLNCTSDNKFCTYTFSDTGDFIWAVIFVIGILFVITDWTLPLIKKKISSDD